MSVDLAKLRQLVGHSPYSWHQLIKKAKIKRSAYRYWNGTREFPLDIALRIAFYLGVPANDFLDAETLYIIRNTVREK